MKQQALFNPSEQTAELPRVKSLPPDVIPDGEHDAEYQTTDTLMLFIRSTRSLPDGWSWFHLERGIKGDKNPKVPPGMCRIEGAVAPLKANGCHNWKKRDKLTEQAFFYSDDEYQSWLEQWCADNGKCLACRGDRVIWRGWNHIRGNRFIKCSKCDGTGQASSNRTNIHPVA